MSPEARPETESGQRRVMVVVDVDEHKNPDMMHAYLKIAEGHGAVCIGYERSRTSGMEYQSAKSLAEIQAALTREFGEQGIDLIRVIDLDSLREGETIDVSNREGKLYPPVLPSSWDAEDTEVAKQLGII